MTFTFTFHYLEIQKDANIHKGGATLITKCYVPGSTVTLLNPPQQGLHFFISHEGLHFFISHVLKDITSLLFTLAPEDWQGKRTKQIETGSLRLSLSLFSFPFQQSVQTLDHTPPLTGLT